MGEVSSPGGIVSNAKFVESLATHVGKARQRARNEQRGDERDQETKCRGDEHESDRLPRSASLRGPADGVVGHPRHGASTGPTAAPALG